MLRTAIIGLVFKYSRFLWDGGGRRQDVAPKKAIALALVVSRDDSFKQHTHATNVKTRGDLGPSILTNNG